MQSSIVNLKNLKCEVSRRQQECHAKGISYVAVDTKKNAITEYLPSGINLVLEKLDMYDSSYVDMRCTTSISKTELRKITESC